MRQVIRYPIIYAAAYVVIVLSSVATGCSNASLDIAQNVPDAPVQRDNKQTLQIKSITESDTNNSGATELTTATKHADKKGAGLSKLAGIVGTMLPGTWMEIRGTLIPLTTNSDAEELKGRNGGSDFIGWTGPDAVVSAWNSAAYDPTHHWWFFFGGGHSDYGGNEVYQFDFETLEWTKLTEPAPLTGPSYVEADRNCPTPQSGPPSVHTYDGLEWNPVTNSIWLLGLTFPFCVDGYGAAPNNFWEFDPERRLWKAHPTDWLPDYPITAWMPDIEQFVIFQAFASNGHAVEVDEQGKVATSGRFDKYLDDAAAKYDRLSNAILLPQENGILRLERTASGWSSRKVAIFPQQVLDLGSKQSGFTFAPKYSRWLMWFGERETVSWDPSTGQFRLYNNQASQQAPASGKAPVYEKWIYISELDVFAGYNTPDQGIWLYKPDWKGGTPTTDKIRACVNDACSFFAVSDAIHNAGDGDIVTIKAGTWIDGGILSANNVTLRGEKGAHLSRKTFDEKAILVVKGNDTTIENVECSGARVSGGNGACVRLEGENLILRNVNVHHNEMGILTGPNTGHVLVERSHFEENGMPGGALGHNLYIQSDSFDFIRSKTLRAQNEGHELKSRAARTVIQDSVLASLDAIDSRVIDIPNGGVVEIKNNVIEQGPNTSNIDVIGVGLENDKDMHEVNSLLIERNTFILDKLGKNVLINAPGIESKIFSGNIIIGGDPVEIPSNTWIPNRIKANLAPYPLLP